MRRSTLLALALGLGILLATRRRRAELPPEIEEAWNMLDTEGFNLTAAPSGVPVQVYAGNVIVDPDALSTLLEDVPPPDRFAVLLFLFAHELNHDPLREDSPAEELDADREAGAILAAFGVDPGVVARSIRPLLGVVWTHTHGDPDARAAAIIEGMSR